MVFADFFSRDVLPIRGDNSSANGDICEILAAGFDV